MYCLLPGPAIDADMYELSCRVEGSSRNHSESKLVTVVPAIFTNLQAVNRLKVMRRSTHNRYSS